MTQIGKGLTQLQTQDKVMVDETTAIFSLQFLDTIEH